MPSLSDSWTSYPIHLWNFYLTRAEIVHPMWSIFWFSRQVRVRIPLLFLPLYYVHAVINGSYHFLYYYCLLLSLQRRTLNFLRDDTICHFLHSMLGSTKILHSMGHSSWCLIVVQWIFDGWLNFVWVSRFKYKVAHWFSKNIYYAKIDFSLIKVLRCVVSIICWICSSAEFIVIYITI